MSADTQNLPPAWQAAGWRPRELPGFIGLCGPLWTRKDGDTWLYGLLPDAGHLNPAGVVHGGALLTLMDHAMSAVAWEACERQACVTLDLSTQFLAAVRAGQGVEARAEVVRRTRQLVFMSGQLTVDGEPVLRGQAILKIVAGR